MIEINNVSKSYGSTKALDAVSCHIVPGQIYGLVGANGAGKSTLLRLCAGIYKADRGEIRLDGQKVWENPAVKEKIILVNDAFLPQSNLKRMGEFYQSAYKTFDTNYFNALCKHMNLPTKTPLRSFSKGMRRQGAILLVLACQPKYLLMDETFDGLDPMVRNEIRSLLYEQILKRNMTAVLSSHSLRELEDTCDQLSLLYKGGLIFESEVSSLKTSLFKLQAAFAADFDKSVLEGLDLLHYSQQGRVCTAILRGDGERAQKLLLERGALLSELLPLRLEEVFLYEMEALGYGFDKEELL